LLGGVAVAGPGYGVPYNYWWCQAEKGAWGRITVQRPRATPDARLR
jgi:hypothetical protein